MTFFHNLNIGKKIYIVAGLIILVFVLTLGWLYNGYRDQTYLTAGKNCS